MASPSDFVTLVNGPTVPLAPLLLLLDLEARGFRFDRDGDRVVIRPRARLTADDVAALRRWRDHVLALLDYEPPEVS